MRFAVFLEHAQIPEFRFSAAHMAALRRAFPEAECVRCRTEAEFLAALPEAQAALVWRFEQAWFARAPRLRAISTPAAGRDLFHVAPPPGVAVLHGAFHGLIMAESVLGMMLSAARSQRRILRGARVVILGFGAIGRRLAQLLEPFDCVVTGIGRGNSADLDAALSRAAHLVCILPSDTGTDGMLDRRRLALMRPDAFVYNVGRGNCIDEDALCDALDGGRLAGAYLDVFKTEPLPADSRLRRTAGAVLTPHISAVAPQYMGFYIEDLAGALPQHLL